MGPPQEVVVLLLLAKMRVRVSMTWTGVEVSLTNRGYQCFVGMHWKSGVSGEQAGSLSQC